MGHTFPARSAWALRFIALAICGSLVSATIVITSPTAASKWTQGQDEMLTWTSDPGDPTLGIDIFPGGGGNGYVISGNPLGTINQLEINLSGNIIPGPWKFTISAVNTSDVLATSPVFTVLPPLATQSTVFFYSTSSAVVVPSSTVFYFSTSSGGSAGANSTASSPPASGASSSPSSTAGSAHNLTSSKSNTGAIAGGVVGGVLLISVIAFLAFLLMRQRRRHRLDDPQFGMAPQGGKGYQDAPSSGGDGAVPMEHAGESWRPYNFDDPSTWPDESGTMTSLTDPGGLGSPTSSGFPQRHSGTGMPHGSDGRPLPEVM